MNGHVPLIIAHRGASTLAPENTLAAFMAAIEAGADGIEFDVQLTRDGIPVVFHDFDLKRIASSSDRIIDLDAAALANVDVGSWFSTRHKKHANEAFAGERIPTLAAVLHKLSDYRARIYLELKADEQTTALLVAAVSEALRGSKLLPQVIVKSFRLSAIPELKHLVPGVRTAALFAPKIMDYLRRKKHIVALAREFGADEISLHRSLASRKLCALANDAGMPATVWTTDSPRWIRRCRKRGIAALITNDPAKMLAARDAS